LGSGGCHGAASTRLIEIAAPGEPYADNNIALVFETHLLGYIHRNMVVRKLSKLRRVFVIFPYAGQRELRLGEM
jgi:hypothetical protein